MPASISTHGRIKNSSMRRDVASCRLHGKAGDLAVPDETVFGIISRFHVLTGHTAAGDTLRQLCGRRNVSLSIAFPSNLKNIFGHLDLTARDVADFINDHTILPYFRLFTNAAHYARLQNSIALDAGAATKISLGMPASRIGAEDLLRFCPECGEEDRRFIGVATWYRIHQLPGVLLCPYHQLPLLESSCLAHRIGRQRLFLPSFDPRFLPTGSNLKCNAIDKLLRVARLSMQILGLQAAVQVASLRNLYSALLSDMDLMSAPYRVDQQQLQTAFLEFWAPLKNLSPFDTLLDKIRQNRDSNWLAGLCRKPRGAHHPLKHILLIGFLADDASSFFHSAPRQAIISQFGVRQKKNKSIDPVFRSLVNENRRSLRQIASLLNISTNTAIIKAEKLGVPIRRRSKKMNAALEVKIRLALARGEAVHTISSTTCLSTSTINRILAGDVALQQQRAACIHENRRANARMNFLAMITKRPDAGCKLIRSAIPADFAWLYRHDRSWLKTHMPIQPRTTRRKAVVDWAERDREMVKEIGRVVEEILNSPNKPIRVTVNEVGRRTGHASWLDKQKGKLCESRRLLMQLVEPVERFQQRRIEWWEKRLAENNKLETVAYWRVYRAAGVRTDRKISTA